MSKRNLTLLIILITIAFMAVFSYFYFGAPPTPADGTTGQNTNTNFFSNFFPSGNNTEETKKGESPESVSKGGGFSTTTTEDTQTSRLKKVSGFPVSGFGIFLKERYVDVPKVVPPAEPTEADAPTTTKNIPKAPKPTPPATEFVPAVRYVERASGNVYQTFADRVREQKFSTTFIPLVHEALFGNNGESVLMRYIGIKNETIVTFSGALDKEILGADSASSVDIKGSFLPENITDLSVSPDGTKIFYLLNTKDGSAGIVSGVDGSKKIQVFDSAYSEWLSQWGSNSMITVTTKPSSAVAGYMYAINPSKKDFNKILGGIEGLTTLSSPDGRLVLYGNSNLSLYLYNIEKRDTVALNLRTLPEKCTWAEGSEAIYCSVPKLVPIGEFPDNWYQDQISFSDDIWKIDVASSVASVILNPESYSGEDIDGIKLAVKENFLFFVNKKDSYLWEFTLR